MTAKSKTHRMDVNSPMNGIGDCETEQPAAAVIQWTTNYAMFVSHQHNRVLRDAKTGRVVIRKDLIESMQSEGYRQEEPIRCYENDDGTATIFDGHNRFFAAQALGLPVAYLAFQRGSSEWTPAKSSKLHRSWSLIDFAKAHANDGNSDYALLLEYAQTTGINLKSMASMLYGQAAHSGNARRAVKDGSFVIRDLDGPRNVASICDTASRYIDWATDDRFVCALSICMFIEGFSVEQMKKKITRFSEFMEKAKDRDGMLAMIDRIYNRHAKTRLEIVVLGREAMKSRGGNARQ